MHNRAPALWILVASLLFATMSALVKVAAASVSLPEIVFFRTLPAAVGLFVLARWRNQTIASPNWKLHLLRCTVGISSMFLGYYAVTRLPLATATTLEYTTPLFMLAYVIVLARRHLTTHMVFAMIGGFAGVLVLLRPSVQAGHMLPFLAGLCSGAIAAVAYTLIRRLGDAGEPASRIVLWYSLCGVLVSAAMIPFGRSSDYNLRTVISLGAVGVVGLFAQLAMTRAFSSGPTTLLASLQYSTVAFAALYGVVLWDDTLSAMSVLGLSLVVVSGIVALRRAEKPIQVEA